MKKIVSLILALVLCAALAIPAMASETMIQPTITYNFKNRYSISLTFSDIISQEKSKVEFFRPDTLLIRVYQGTKMAVNFEDRQGLETYTEVNLLPASPNGAGYVWHQYDKRQPVRYQSAVDSITFDKLGYWFVDFTSPSLRTTPLLDGLYLIIEVREPNYLPSAFGDVSKTDYFADAVLWAAGNGVTTGVDAYSFAPYATLTRAEAVTFLWRANGSPAPQSKNSPFADVAAGSYYYDAVLWAVENGITTGVSSHYFNVSGYVTRGEMLTFLWRAAGRPNDIGGQWYESAENWAKSSDLLRWGAVTYQTDESCPRCDAVYYMYRSMV